jgi:hypothetical protein
MFSFFAAEKTNVGTSCRGTQASCPDFHQHIKRNPIKSCSGEVGGWVVVVWRVSWVGWFCVLVGSVIYVFCVTVLV